MWAESKFLSYIPNLSHFMLTSLICDTSIFHKLFKKFEFFFYMNDKNVINPPFWGWSPDITLTCWLR